ncbi:MAG: Major Facilitator Superfamily protein, partial [Phycisphaerales bacterium]|nr:Major Facilitator Superfamily protein [Phycisphaerales bacterium]
MTIEASPLLGLPTVGGAPLAESSRRSLFIASFMTLIAAGLGFAIRGAIIGDWGAQFGFTKSDLGAINGVGLAGLGITIVFFAFFADLVGYRALLLLAFALFAISGVVTLCAGPAFNSGGKNAAFYTLYAGTFIFAIGHGCIEAAINPLTATLYPKEKTHYLNILHAGWPGGLMLGGVLNYLLHGKEAKLVSLPWQVLAVLY